MEKLKAIYVGVNGKPVKVWDQERGVLDPQLYEYAKKAVSADG